MPKQKEPIDLIKAKGKKHLTKKEYNDRKDEELEVPVADEISPPAYLKNRKQKDEFMKYAEMLKNVGIFTELDVDCLGMYVMSRSLYEDYTKQINKVLKKADLVHKWATIDALSLNCDDATELKELLEKILKRQRGDDINTFMSLQDRAFKQCIACAKELGLTIGARCKLIIPKVEDEDDDL